MSEGTPDRTDAERMTGSRAASHQRRSWHEYAVAIAAVVAAIGTVAAAWFAQVQIADERAARHDDERAQRAADLRSQAVQVSAWPVATDSSGFPLSNTPEGPVTKIALYNGS